MEIIECEKYKEQGNEAFKDEKWDDALKHYTKAINSVKGEPKELAIYCKNRAAAYLKLGNYEKAIEDCDKSLDVCPNDPKALFRRCQALESLQRFEEAYRDATQIFKDDPANKTIQPYLQRLHKIVEERARINSQTSTKLDTMLKIVFDPSNDKEKRETAMNNLLVLAREHAGSEVMIKSPVVQKIKNLLKIEKNQTLYVTGVRIIGELCKHSEDKTKTVMKDVGVPWFLEILDSKNQEVVTAAQYCLQCILNSLSGMENKADSKPKKELVEKNKSAIDTLLTCLTVSINERTISGLARDAIIELLTRNIHYTTLEWAEQLVEKDGVRKLLDCCSELQEFHYESAMDITPSTRTIAAVCLARVYENMYYDKAKEIFLNKVQDFIKEKLLSPDIESKVRITVVITELLRGPLDLGNILIGKEGIIEMILVMANTEDDELQQKVACECIIAAASKADKARSILAQGTDILKKLYKSKNDHIRIRALVGLCKLSSYGGNDATIKPFAEGSTLKLAEACRRFLLHPGKDTDIRKWSAEGLSYLTLDAEVKEKLIEDKAALKALVELAKSGDQSVIFGVITTLVNLCNAYEKQEVIPEMVQLAKFAKQHIPEEHELDDPDFVTKRLVVLGQENFTTALVALSKTESANSRELISRVFNALASEHELRGIMVQQGAVKVLIKLALDGTEKGKRQASQALARIGITMNPEIAFPGQRSLECIKPLLSLLHQDCTGLENFEALMALCNIAQMNETARQRIVKEQGFFKIEHYMYEDHEYISRAALQCMCNLVQSEDIVKTFFESENDRVKFIVSCCLDEDQDSAMAASGMLAVLTSYSEKCCEKIFDSKNWLEAIQCLLANKLVSMQYRGVCIVANIINASKVLTEKLMESSVLEILMALKLLPDEDSNRKKINEVIEDALKTAEKYGVIKKPEDENDD
ncbi:unnamed protein product [Ceutorhynchus assimilis]|uniref:Protein unc-45 homolog B n=1 Tax=Ceutorhynchus assimilis TaxID=467358 RepID=A0A9N9MVA2_9CUCU|nr:unnamed protein product [Ceutorhynchus assimilis]